MIYTAYDNQKHLITDIKILYGIDRFDLDPTYNKGVIHYGNTPKCIMDINPVKGSGAEFGDSTCLPYDDYLVDSVLFDPPFLYGGGDSGIMNRRYSSFKDSDAMFRMYYDSMNEIHRVLNYNGYLVFKCQDILNGRTQTFTHCEIYKMALEIGFYARDLFVLKTKNKAKPHNMTQQLHARKNHSYFWVLQKIKKNNKTYL